MQRKTGIIGFGNMGSAIAEQIKADYKVIVFDKDGTKLSNLPGIQAADTISDLVGRSDVVILAVKPQDFDPVLAEIKNCKHLTDKLFVSIAAGITTSYVENILGVARVIRAMPNMLARIGEGITCLCRGKFATDEDFDLAEDLFEYTGEILVLNKEDEMSAATAVSGSGPAYICNFIEKEKIAISDVPNEKKEAFLTEFRYAAKAVGFDNERAAALTQAVWNGTIAYFKKTSIDPQLLIKQVMSKGGTTEAAFKVLHSGGTIKAAVEAAKKRADELSK